MSIRAISPIDGRYAGKTAALADYFSEWALMKYRFMVEVRWLVQLSQTDAIPEVRPLTAAENTALQSLITNFDEAAGQRVKTIERTTNHDVKAIEYYLKEQLVSTSLADLSEFVHFGCTSEDINNLAYALMTRDALHEVWLPQADAFIANLTVLARDLRSVAMLARTHGQPATPTTLGKELAVFVLRLRRQRDQLASAQIDGKFSGAVGAFNAHLAAYPAVDWVALARAMVEDLGLTFNPLTTQIEPHDWMAEHHHAMMRFNSVLLDLCRDMWTYISMGYFKQKTVAGEVGSSTMPHKVNPIDFENAEANCGLSNAVLGHLAGKLPVSRLQRDLSDSSALRNTGVGIAHSDLALQSASKGLGKVLVDTDAIGRDLDGAWEVLAEAIQTVLRKAAYPDPYEKLKELTRGRAISADDLRQFIDGLPIPADDKARLQAMTPATYIGLAAQLVDDYLA